MTKTKKTYNLILVLR